MKKAPRFATQVFLYLVFSIIFICVCITLTLFPFLKSKNAYAKINSPTPIVVIDAGHGGEDGGAIGVNGCYEKDINFSIAKKLKTYLSSMGIRCVLTRNSDTLLYDRNADYEGHKKHLDMLARLDITNSYENAIFVSIHQNSFPQEKYSGLQVYYSENNESSLPIAKSIEKGIKEILQPQNSRSAKASGKNIYLLDKLECPAVLIECGFLSNKNECELLCSDEYQNLLSAVIAARIAEFIS